LGQGYEICISGAYVCTENIDDVVVGSDRVHGNDLATTDDASVKSFLEPLGTQVGMRIASDLCPCRTIDQVKSSQFPTKAQQIEVIFSPAAPAHQAALPLPHGAFTITSAADVEKEAEAKKGITKLLLYHIAAELDLKAGTMANIFQAVLSAGTESVLTSPRAVRPQSYSDLLRKACHMVSTQDAMSIRSTQMTLKLIQKMVSSNLFTRKLRYRTNYFILQ
jgi:hypothetical protein